MSAYDLLVVGGGPAGAAAAWRAASSGARVLVIDKATFPRDKPCGDGLTPRAVKAVHDMGLGSWLDGFQRMDRLKVHGAGRTLEFTWPDSERFPRYGHVIARTELDAKLLSHAADAGAEVREGVGATAPIQEDGLVRGVTTAHGELRANAVVIADGATSRIGRALGMLRLENRPLGVAVRSHFPSRRPDEPVIESWLELRDGDELLPGYGWVFPMGGGRINVGVGLLSTYKGWKSVNTAHLMRAFLAALPASWELPSFEQVRSEHELKGWRLPMAFAIWPPWCPGALGAGDAAGVVNPFNGEGISEAIESGIAATETALDALNNGGPRDLSAYVTRLDEMWGPYYRLGRTFVRAIGNPKVMRAATALGMRVPPVMSFAFKALANLYREQGGTVGDATMRGMLRLANRVRVG